jgi:hypothetical protein
MYLNGPVSHALDFEFDPLPPFVQLDVPCVAFHGNDGTRLLCFLVHACLGQRQERAIERLLEVAIIRRDGMVDSDKVGAGGEGALDHQLCKRRDDWGHDMAASQHCLADGHEVRDRVLAITNELYGSARWSGMCAWGQYFLKIIRDERLKNFSLRRDILAGTHSGLGVVQLHASRKATLGEKAKLRDDELVELAGWLAGVG